ncbi:hypothetical protein AKJ51_02015 [candidate division MSBL1 archaeon SCGC-AAA382A20]|uniref:MAGE domain-containing protein n=1 Tax=candidate division MSBL1 archaeon SCGC-AAA382A20 TaxID=1698280 RepID=A0A133VL19_9EURY|nr:hypothetical protein AKJ51_02015 [candidate division MSBL1 archaeon SCGC-AAA382A20]
MPEDEEGIEAVRDKMERAAQLILFKRHREPGAKSWELKQTLGKRYEEIVDMLDQELQRLGLTIKEIQKDEDKPARYYATMKGHPRLSDRTFGWRIDDMACLTITLAYIQSKRGKAPIDEVKDLLQEKIPKWRVDQNINRFTKMGYISEEEGMLKMGWRADAEIDQKEMLEELLSKEIQGSEKE